MTPRSGFCDPGIDEKIDRATRRRSTTRRGSRALGGDRSSDRRSSPVPVDRESERRRIRLRPCGELPVQPPMGPAAQSALGPVAAPARSARRNCPTGSLTATFPPYTAFVYLGAYGALRYGELAALRLDHVKLRRVEVVETLDSDEPKWGSSGSVPIPAFVANVLAEHLAQSPPGPSGLVFTAAGGRPAALSEFLPPALAPGRRGRRRRSNDAPRPPSHGCCPVDRSRRSSPRDPGSLSTLVVQHDNVHLRRPLSRSGREARRGPGSRGPEPPPCRLARD